MKKLFTLAVACLVTAVGAWANSPDSPTNFTVNVTLNADGTATVSGSLKAPTVYYWPEDPLTSIDRIEITRSSYDAGESDEPVYTIPNPTPGETYTFTDECELPLQMGCNYTYYAKAFDATSEGHSAYKQVFVGIRPKAPGVGIATADRGKAPITLTMVAPTLTENGDELTVPLTKLVIKEYISYSEQVERHAIENPVAGQTYTWVNPDVTEGNTYSYRVYAECAYGTSDPNSAEILVGEDVPSSPRNVNVTIGDDGKATLTWEAPAKGKNDGWIDPAAVRYKIQRNNGGSFTAIEDNCQETTYVDALADLTALAEVSWRITAFNAKGDGDYVYTSTYLVGPAMALPFVENANRQVEDDWYGGVDYYLENMWTLQNSNYSYWEVKSYDYYTGITGVDSTADDDEGFIRFSGEYADEDGEWMHSPDIDVDGAKYLVLSFHYTDILKDNAIEAGYVKGQETVALQNVSTNGAPDDDAGYTWRRAIVPFGNLGDAQKIKVHFRGYSPDNNEDGGYIGLDKIVLDDYCPLEAVNVQNSDNAANLSWEPATNGRLTADRYLVAVNGAEPVETAATSHSVTTVKGENYTVSVTPVYGDIPSAPTTVSFIGGAQVGITGIQADETEVEYFTPDGLRALDPQKGMLLIRRAVTRDGKVRTSKVVF